MMPNPRDAAFFATNVIDPALLKADARKTALKVFLCGPGIASRHHDLRKQIKDFLENTHDGNVSFGEDIDDLKLVHRKKSDLQTLEWRFAHIVDFTILMLESPGAIAELGTFSMTPDIRPRLFVVVPSEFYRSNSYIARGPLSLISSYSASNIIYYDKGNPNDLLVRLLFPVTMYKFIKSIEGYDYYRSAINYFRSDKFEAGNYEGYFNPLRDNFIKSVVLAGIIMLIEPTFAELVRRLRLEPQEVSRGLHHLFVSGSVTKTGVGRYRAVNSYRDGALAKFSSSMLSRRRAEILAVT